ncbi:MAG: hypothetical protein KDB35_14945 [Acidimicrobiales bacterium]|nr:hypothetical protein [Acidimicrobiales bacterium]
MGAAADDRIAERRDLLEKLARVLLRAVWTEVAGRRSEAGEDAIERRVGQSVAGVCQQTG